MLQVSWAGRSLTRRSAPNSSSHSNGADEAPDNQRAGFGCLDAVGIHEESHLLTIEGTLSDDLAAVVNPRGIEVGPAAADW